MSHLNVKRNLKPNNVTNDVLKQDLNSNGLPLLHDELLDYEQNEELKKMNLYTLLQIIMIYKTTKNLQYFFKKDCVLKEMYDRYIREFQRRKTLSSYNENVTKRYLNKINNSLV